MKLLYVLYYKILFQWIKRRRRNETIARCLDNIVAECEGDRICFYFGDEKWTYKQIQALSFRVANHFQEIGLKKGDSVGLAMTNRPEMAAIWIGLGRIGPCLKSEMGNEVTIFAPIFYELERFMEDPKWIPENQDFTHLFPTIDLAACLFKVGPQPTSVAKDQEPNYLDPILYLFTSGTTGIPKLLLVAMDDSVSLRQPHPL
ncbi:Long-chain fatty acid transport protein 4 [Orchesella cincta]|uniref:Long-chain-fatty-acid--CoA ligase n=1 Tax=Orchesella cincta TaxID=48709 RepID=A0A1D2M4X4_ORCCI|nr:Long-chain fatty acid transport protein 4 [Orchesella cincta]